jgi:hypothetical protein
MRFLGALSYIGECFIADDTLERLPDSVIKCLEKNSRCDDWRAFLCPLFPSDQLILMVLKVLRIGQFRIRAGSVGPAPTSLRDRGLGQANSQSLEKTHSAVAKTCSRARGITPHGAPV